MKSDLGPLIVIFGFIVILLFIRRFFQWQCHKLWHETARLALEKGQPVPPAGPDPDMARHYWRRRRGGLFDFRRGLILLALGAGLYFCGAEKVHTYALIPVLIGAAFMVMGVVSHFVSDKTGRDRDNDPADRV